MNENLDAPLKSGIDGLIFIKCDIGINMDNFNTPDDAVKLLNTLKYAVKNDWEVQLKQKKE